MATKYTPDRKTIGNILSLTNPPVVVPDWQRNYSWTTSEIETFRQDILLFDSQYPGDNINDQEYFLGAVVIVDTNQSHLLLDGQQRIASSAILLSVIRDFLARYNQDAATRVTTRYLTDFDDALNDYTYKVTLNRYDRDFFKREILETRSQGYEEPTPIYESHNLIRKARRYFFNYFDKKYNELADPHNFHQWALRFLKLTTNHISFVAVISSDEDNASNVFETLNDRGIGLSTPDLLRNLLLRRAIDADRDEIMDLWGEILEIENDAKLQDFLRHYWLSHRGDVKTRSLYREIKYHVVNEEMDCLQFSRSLRDSSIVYRDILNSESDGNENISELLISVNELGSKVLFSAILSVLEAREDDAIKANYLWKFIVAYVRHTVISKKENSQIENLMFKLAKKIREENNDQEIWDEIAQFIPDDVAFKAAFTRASVPRRASARYILKKIEHSLRETEELQVATPSRVHVEHIYPQTPTQEQRLPNHNVVINRIGNLTLLSARLNTAIKNSIYADKKPYYEQSELFLTNQIAEKYDDWNVEIIDHRQESIAEQAVNIWKLEY